MVTVQVGDRSRSTAVLPRRSIPMWAATIDASRCNPNVRPKLVAFQDEAADALAAAILPDSAPLAERLEKAIAPRVAKYEQIARRLGTLESNGTFGARAFLLVPRLDPEKAGYSMQAVNKRFIEKGFNIPRLGDPRIRSHRSPVPSHNWRRYATL